MGKNGTGEFASRYCENFLVVQQGVTGSDWVHKEDLENNGISEATMSAVSKEAMEGLGDWCWLS